MNRTIEVKILGRNFNFHLPKDIKPDDFLEIINYVESKIDNIKKELADLDFFKIVLLAAINIAEEYITVQKENTTLKQMLNKIDSKISPLVKTSIKDKKQDLPIKFSS